jgi:hypothetical protein
VIIGTILLASVGLGFANKYKAEKAAEALRSSIRHRCVMLRGGHPHTTPSRCWPRPLPRAESPPNRDPWLLLQLPYGGAGLEQSVPGAGNGGGGSWMHQQFSPVRRTG